MMDLTSSSPQRGQLLTFHVRPEKVLLLAPPIVDVSVFGHT